MGEEAGIEVGAEAASRVSVSLTRSRPIRARSPSRSPSLRAPKNPRRFSGVKLPMGGAEKGDEPPAIRRAPEQASQSEVEVPYKPPDLEARVLGTSRSPLSLSALSLTSSGT